MNLNFFPINFDFRKYQINTDPYSDERIKELRQKYNTTHSNTVTNIFGFLGIGLSSLFKYIPPILVRAIRKTFGYNILSE